MPTGLSPHRGTDTALPPGWGRCGVPAEAAPGGHDPVSHRFWASASHHLAPPPPNRRTRSDIPVKKAPPMGGGGVRRSFCKALPGGFGAFGTYIHACWYVASDYSFNPPGGFGAFGTKVLNPISYAIAVSIRRADLGLLELLERVLLNTMMPGFQSAGRIWGFWNNFKPSGVFACHKVSIRRADLGLLEQGSIEVYISVFRGFNPPGGFGAFGTRRSIPIAPQ